MADIVQHACKPDPLVHKKAQDLGRSVRKAGVKGRNAITSDGYIISSVALGEHTVSRVIDPPMMISWDSLEGFDTLDGVDMWQVTEFGMRGILSPKDETLINVGAIKRSSYKLPAHRKYVGFEVPLSRNPTNIQQGFRGVGQVLGEWASCPFASVFRDTGGNEYNALVFMATNWRSATNSNADVLPESEDTIVLIIPGEIVRSVTTGLDISGATGGGSFGKCAACVEAYTDPAGTKVLSVYMICTVHIGIYTSESILGGAYFVARIDVRPGAAQTFVWARRLDAPDIGYHMSGTGIWLKKGAAADGSLDTLVAAVNTQADTDETSSKLVVLSKATGATQGVYAGPADGQNAMPVYAYPAAGDTWCSVRGFSDVLFETVASNTLVRVRGTSVSAATIPGYQLGTGKQPGMSGAIAGSTHVNESIVVDLGAGQVGVLVIPAGTYSNASTPSYYMAVLDADTLALVRVMGPIGTTSPLVSYGGATHQLSVVTPQVLDTSGNVTTPAVLLSVLGDIMRSSTDGGATWKLYGQSPAGMPVYRGNKLHPVQLGKTL